MADFKTEHYGVQGETHEGWKSDCPRCTAPGAAFIEDTHATGCPALVGEPCRCTEKLPGTQRHSPGLPVTAPGSPIKVEQPSDDVDQRVIWTTAERDARIERGDTGLYYAVSAQHRMIVTNKGRPLYATLAEWKSVENTIRPVAYIPTTGGRQTEPMFGSQPLFNRGAVPDVVGQLVKTLGVFDALTKMFADRGATLDAVLKAAASGVEDLGTIIGQRIHFVELLDRAATLIDPDAETYGGTHEQRLDWLAKYRETVGR